ncbi:EAL domain-containing protein [Effusibacillus lacus]|uniref:EAL domain-containing protein n=1 Tax=Effusibacillus lacus TaxID=1348429 RepID=UPI000BB826BE|nr:EAL domain-containing protein [Effusibacillus lacus]TCS70650.1 PAS domain S-box-containing protein/diguanylate cyclase (GGDEF)-like protein [Effusibacillus lacus]
MEVLRRTPQSKLSEEELRLAIQVYKTTSEGVVILDATGKIQLVNPAFTAITGYSAEEVIGQKPPILKYGRQGAGFYANIWATVHDAGKWQGEIWHRRKNGEIYPTWVTVSAIRNEAGSITHCAAVILDITRLKRVEEQLHLVSKVIENTVEGIVVTDIHGSIQLVNPAFTAITGYSPEEVIGKNPRILNSGRHDAEFYISMWASIHETGKWEGEIWNRRKNGEIYPEWLTISAVSDEMGKITHYAATFTDITERKSYEERIVYQAHHDTLTGLPNRTFFQNLTSQLDHAKQQNQMLAVLIIDLDRFKGINESLGHSAGDRLLQGVAERLKSCVRDGDIVARLGGDEFALLLTQITSEKDVVRRVRHIAEVFKEPLICGSEEIFTSMSMGISLYPADGKDMEELLKNADTALYRARELGGGHYQFYTPEMNSKAFERLALETDLRKALDRQEFVLYYQPKVDMQTGQIVGMETLIRWEHPDLGTVSPAEFISLAEETGLIIPIGEWVLHTACKQNKAWQQAGFSPLRVAVNLSARQFRQTDLVATVARVLHETGLDPEYLELEITESIALENADRTIATLNELRTLGVRISIDDFGTGYSSLSYLKKFPIDTLKIDRSFVREIDTNLSDAAIVTAIITLAHSLNLKVVAEGVETPVQQAFLLKQKCDEMQGYLFSRPVPVSSFERLMAASTKGGSAND